MRVLYVTTSFPRFEGDYAGSFVFRWAKYASESGADVSVVAPGEGATPKHSQFDAVTVHRFSYFWPLGKQCLAYNAGILSNLRNSWLARIQLPFFLIALWFSCVRRVRAHDVVHCHWLPTVWLVVFAKVVTFSSVPIIFTNWGSDTRSFPKWLINLTCRFCKSYISSAVETSKHLELAGIKDFDEVMVPVDEDRFSVPFDKAEYLESEFGMAPDTKIVSHIGRLNYFKDPLFFIEACSLLVKQGVEFKALLVGEGDLYNECEALITKFDLQDVVLLTGVRSDIERIMAVSIITTHLSPIENTWANVISEAMFVGCPVIMTRVGYTEETFQDGQNCLLVNPKDPVDLARKLESLLGDDDLRSEISEGAKRLLDRKRKYQHQVKEDLLSVYTKCIH